MFLISLRSIDKGNLITVPTKTTKYPLSHIQPKEREIGEETEKIQRKRKEKRDRGEVRMKFQRKNKKNVQIRLKNKKELKATIQSVVDESIFRKTRIKKENRKKCEACRNEDGQPKVYEDPEGHGRAQRN